MGTPGDVADKAQGLFRLRRRRGFMLSPIYSPGAAEEFVTWWCPNCSGAAFRRKYAAFKQRDHLSVRNAEAPAGAMPRTDHPSDATAKLTSLQPTFSKPRNTRS